MDPAARRPLHWFGMCTTRCAFFPGRLCPAGSGAEDLHSFTRCSQTRPCLSAAPQALVYKRTFSSTSMSSFPAKVSVTSDSGEMRYKLKEDSELLLLSSPRSSVTSSPGGGILISITADADITQPIKREGSVNSCRCKTYKCGVAHVGCIPPALGLSMLPSLIRTQVTG